MNSEIYRETILEHYANPVNAGDIPDADATARDFNPSCGDVVEIQAKFSDGIVKDIKFRGEGCAISQSSVDILLDIVKNKTIAEVENFTTEDFLEILGIELSPLRLKCALLGLNTLKTAVHTYLTRV